MLIKKGKSNISGHIFIGFVIFDHHYNQTKSTRDSYWSSCFTSWSTVVFCRFCVEKTEEFGHKNGYTLNKLGSLYVYFGVN